MYRSVLAVALAASALWLAPMPARASFHIAEISEIMTSYGGDANVQFVEIRMITVGQQFVAGTKLNAFDASGNFIATVLTVPSNVQGGAGRPWIMGTPAFETASGLQVDFEFANGSLPTGGGMVCWGQPGNNTTTVSCPTTGSPYVDCIAYGTYSGPTNSCIGNPTPQNADGHSLERIDGGNDNLTDFACSNPAEPQNNAFESASLSATTPCPNCGNDTVESGEECDGTDSVACPGACLSNCVCAVCGDGAVNAPGEICEIGEDAACPGDCLADCTCATCGDDVAEPPAEQCDGTDDSACPGECLPPGETNQCFCPPGPLDAFLCYKANFKKEVSPALADVFDSGAVTSKGIFRFCAPADTGGGLSDPATHLNVYKIKGEHVKRSDIQVDDSFGTFVFDTKKAKTFMVPTNKSIFPAFPPQPVGPPSVVDHFRCLRAKNAKGTEKIAKGTKIAVVDQFGVRQVEIKKALALCLPTDKNGEGINRPESHLLCYKIKPLIKHKPDGVQTRDQFGDASFRLKGEVELCVPATLP